MIEQNKKAKLGFQKPETWKIEIPISIEPAQHASLMQNFTDAILDGVPLISPGEEGLNSIELANVMLYSGSKQKDGSTPVMNVSPFGEWRWSPMGLAGRDPIFYAQLDSEIAFVSGEGRGKDQADQQHVLQVSWSNG